MIFEPFIEISKIRNFSEFTLYLDLNSMDKVRSDEKINNVGALVLNDNKLSKIDLKDFSVSTS